MSNFMLPPQKIAVLRPLQFGDLMCTVPAFRALRAAFPEAEISLIGLPWSISFVKRFHHYLDHLIEFPGFPGFPEQPPKIDQFPDFLLQAQAERFDLALQMQGSGSLSNSIIELLGAKITAGFYLEGLYCPNPSTYLRYPVGEHEIIRHLRLMDFLDIPRQGVDLEFPIHEEDWQAFAGMQAYHDFFNRDYVIIHPGARAADRRWPPERFAAVADGIAEHGFRVVLTGTEAEREITRAVAAQMMIPPLDLTGETTYGTMATLLAGARLLISNDTGVSHLAAALKVPSVVLFSNSEPDRWGPMDQKLHRRILWASAAPPVEVIREAEQLLLEERVYAS